MNVFCILTFANLTCSVCDACLPVWHDNSQNPIYLQKYAVSVWKSAERYRHMFVWILAMTVSWHRWHLRCLTYKALPPAVALHLLHLESYVGKTWPSQTEEYLHGKYAWVYAALHMMTGKFRVRMRWASFDRCCPYGAGGGASLLVLSSQAFVRASLHTQAAFKSHSRMWQICQ